MQVHSGVWKPSVTESEKKLAGSCEITNLSLKAGGGAAFVAFYDAVDSAGAIPSNLKWVLDASTTDVDNESFAGLVFSRGVYAICEQGADFNPVVCIAANKYIV